MAPVLLIGLVLQGGQDSLTLDAALALARTHRGQVRFAAAQAAVARADARAAIALPNPTAAYSHTGNPPRGHATIDQPLDWLLRRSTERAAGRADLEAALADSTQLLAGVARDARGAFYATVGAARGLALAEEEAVLAESLAEIAARRRSVGEISALEQAQAALEAARARQLVSSSREKHGVAVAELGRALGMASESLPPPAGALDAQLSMTPPRGTGVDDLPVVARARADSVAAGARSQSARRARVPLPSFQAGVDWNNPGQPATVLLGFAVPIPLWQNGGAQAAAAVARAEQASAVLRETRSDAARLLAQSVARVQESARRALVARDTILPLATRQRELALAAYRAGETGIVPVLDALRAEREVVRELVMDLVAHQQAVADWLALMGRIQ